MQKPTSVHDALYDLACTTMLIVNNLEKLQNTILMQHEVKLSGLHIIYTKKNLLKENSIKLPILSRW